MAVTNKIFIPALISSVTYQPVRTLPHVYFYNGLKDCEQYFIQHYASGSTNVSSSAQIKFPYVDYYDGLEPGLNSNSLLFFNETPPYGVTPTGSLYTEYWETYVSLLYNPRTRLFKASAIIPLADYFEMELNDIVQWRGNYYHLRAINDYNLKDGTCQLELLGPIIRDIAATDTFDCTFDFSSSVEPNPNTTTTTTSTTTTAAPTTTTTSTTTTTTTSTTTTLAPTTTTTTSAPTFITARMNGATSGSFVSGGLDWNFISFVNSSTASQYPILNVLSGNTTTAKVLVIGGGGAGGWEDNAGTDGGGGGGAGQVRFFNNVTISSGSYEITIGAGGAAPTSGNKGGNGTLSDAGQIISSSQADFGAGGGGSTPENDGRASVNGSGGGGAETGTGGFGGQSSGGNSNSSAAGGGGGGASGNGSTGNSTTGGNGGPGLTFTGLTTSSLSVGGGGAGSGTVTNGTATDGGGDGGAPGTNGTGGGGGGSRSNNPGKGGGGRFIITYRSN